MKPVSFPLQVVAAVTNLLFSFTMLGQVALAAPSELEKAKFMEAKAAVEKELSKLSKAELRDLQGQYIDMINGALADLERAMQNPEEYKAELIAQVEESVNDLRSNGTAAEGPAAAESVRNFNNALNQMKRSTPNFEMAYKQLSELRDKLESLDVGNVFKGIAAVFATIFLAIGGVLLGGILIIAGVLLTLGSLGILLWTGIPQLLIIGGTGMVVGSCVAIEAVWKWALR